MEEKQMERVHEFTLNSHQLCFTLFVLIQCFIIMICKTSFCFNELYSQALPDAQWTLWPQTPQRVN